MRRVEPHDMMEMAMVWMVRCGLMVANTILWRNRIVENPTAVVSSRQTDLVTVMVTDGERVAGNPTAVVSLRQTDLVTVMVTDGERVAGNPTVVVGSRQTGPVTVIGPDREEISSWVIKMGGSQTAAAIPY